VLKGLYILHTDAFDKIYGPHEREDIARLVDIYAPRQSADAVKADPSILVQAEVIFTGWGGPRMDAEFLAAAPQLKVVFYGAGSIKRIVTDAFWDRRITITSAFAANAIPVAEYTLSQILFCLKHGWHYALTIKRDQSYPVRTRVPGAYGSTVGLIALGMIGRRVCQLLEPFDLKVIAYDPYVSPSEAEALGVELCSLDELFRRSDVVSLHAPWLKETENMITGTHFAAMKPGATFINTARGAIVHEPQMIDVLRRRSDLLVVLDVTYPEPPAPGSPLYTLPNVVLTPHIAGSLDTECRRMGRSMVEELQRYVAGEQLHWSISKEQAALLA